MLPFEWFVAIRYLRDAKGQTSLILAAVSVGVSVIIFISALIGGLQTSLIQKTLGSQPHISMRMPREEPRPLVEPAPGQAIVRNTQKAAQRLRSIDEWLHVVARAEQTAGVTAVSASVTGAGFAIRGEAKTPIVVMGVEAERFLPIIDLRSRMQEGHYDLTGGQVVIGSVLAGDLGVAPGDKIRIETTEGVVDTVSIAGVFTVGNRAVDQTWLVTPLRHAQSLFAIPGGATTIDVKVSDVFTAETIANELQAQTGLEAESWMKKNQELLSGLSAQSSSKLLIQFFVVLAVALGIASVLIVAVSQKAREIGILRAVGTAPRRVLVVFLIQGGVLGFVGSFLGSAFGALLSKAFEGAVREPNGAPKFPVDLSPSLFLGATVLSTLVGLVAAVIPARSASRLDPATAIRNG